MDRSNNCVFGHWVHNGISLDTLYKKTCTLGIFNVSRSGLLISNSLRRS